MTPVIRAAVLTLALGASLVALPAAAQSAAPAANATAAAAAEYRLGSGDVQGD